MRGWTFEMRRWNFEVKGLMGGFVKYVVDGCVCEVIG